MTSFQGGDFYEDPIFKLGRILGSWGPSEYWKSIHPNYLRNWIPSSRLLEPTDAMPVFKAALRGNKGPIFPVFCF